MSVTKNKTGQKSNKKSEKNEISTVNSLQKGQAPVIQQTRKRTSSKNIDWEQVLDFDALALKDQVYEAPWMQSTKRRKRIFHSTDKSEPKLPNQNNINEDCDIDKNELPLASKQNSNNISLKEKTGVINSGKPNGQKKQIKSITNGVSSENIQNLIKSESSSSQKSSLKAKVNCDMELEIPSLKSEESIKKTRLQSQKERNLKSSSDDIILLSNKQNENSTPVKNINKTQQETPTISSKNNSSLQEDKILMTSRAMTRQEEKKLQKMNGETSESQQSIQSPQRNYIKPTAQIIEQESSFKKDAIDESRSDKLQLNQKNRQRMKPSPTSFRLNEEVNGINQSYDDSDASTRDEDHQETQNKNMASNKGLHLNNVDNKRKNKSGEKQNTTQKNIGGEKKKIGNDQLEEDKNQNKDQDSSLTKIKQFKNKSTSQEAGEDNKINYKTGDNNNQKNKLINKKLIKNKSNQFDQIELSNKKSLIITSDQNVSNQTEPELKPESNESLSSIVSKSSLKSDKSTKSSQNKNIKSSSTKNTRHKGQQYKKSYFSKQQSKESNDELEEEKDKPSVSSSSLPSDQILDKIEDEMNVDESAFENSNNNVSILLQQQDQLAQDQQQQVPHLYIRNQDQAIKVGRKYQAIIPEIGSYKVQDKHLERLITEQKVWGSDWIENNESAIEKCTATLKQWYGHRRNSEQCIQQLLLLGFDSSQYNKFLEENQDYLYSLYNQMDSKYIKKKVKKRILYSYK